MTDQPRIAIFASFSGQGGVERMLLRLAGGFVASGATVDLVLVRAEGAHLQALPEGVNVIRLDTRHTRLALPGLVRYLRETRPTAVLAAKDRAIRVAARARRRAGVDTRLVGRLGTNLGASLAHKSALQRWLRLAPMRRAYRDVNAIVAVSEGVAEDTRRITGLPPERIRVIANPVVGEDLPHLAAATAPHPWLAEHDEPVVVGAGRLTRQKDFPTLLRALARLRRERPARLIILGEGGDRESLLALARELGAADAVDLPGFTDNPYAYLGRADLFVLSSLWEGSPNVLTEALALGTPVVATDCPSGPREVLRGGQFGPLVPMGDAAALAAAMRATLDAPLPAERLREAVRAYHVATSAAAYLEVLGVAPRSADSDGAETAG